MPRLSWSLVSSRVRSVLLLALAVFCSSCSDVEGTYKFPDVSTGFLVSQDRVSVLMGVEVWDFHRFAGDLVLAEDLAALGLTYRVTSMFEIKLGAYAGWDFSLEEPSYGGAFLMTEF